MPPTLIDTNLLVYLYDPNQPDKQNQSERVLEQLELTRNPVLSWIPAFAGMTTFAGVCVAVYNFSGWAEK